MRGRPVAGGPVQHRTELHRPVALGAGERGDAIAIAIHQPLHDFALKGVAGIHDMVGMPSCSQMPAASTRPSAQQAPLPLISQRVRPSTSQPASTSSAAVSELSTPPERPTATRCSPGQWCRRSRAACPAVVEAVGGAGEAAHQGCRPLTSVSSHGVDPDRVAVRSHQSSLDQHPTPIKKSMNFVVFSRICVAFSIFSGE